MPAKWRPPIERFNEKVRLGDGCWEWTAYVGSNGYGRFYFEGRGALAHRWSYEFYKGQIPEGLVIDHLCRNRSCVNPEHLAVAQSVNVLRGLGPQVVEERGGLVTHCPQGHQYTEENTYRGGRGRTCVTCKKANARAYYERNRDLVIARAAESAKKRRKSQRKEAVAA